LQKDPASTQNLEVNGESFFEESNKGKGLQLNCTNESLHENKFRGDIRGSEGSSIKDVSGSKQVLGMSRKDSFGDLLLHLPQIASLPKLLFNISEEDGDNQDI
jgi:hypothetical protein